MASEIHVSTAHPDGVRTIREAWERAAAAASDTTILLHDPMYQLRETLVLDQSRIPAGRTIRFSAAPSSRPVISGGREIELRGEMEAMWRLEAPPPPVRDLWIAGHRAERMRSDDLRTFLPDLDTRPDGFWTSSPGPAAWPDPTGVEMGFLVEWSHMIVGVDSVRPEEGGSRIIMRQPELDLCRRKEGVRAGRPSILENTGPPAVPGQWWLDAARGEILYLPRETDDPAGSGFVAPVLEVLLEIRGSTAPHGRIELSGLTFSHTGWNRPSTDGHVDLQANFTLRDDHLHERDGHITNIHNECRRSPAGVVLDSAREVRFESCTFAHLGGAGIDILRGSRDVEISGCELYDIAGSGIQVGGVDRLDHHPDSEDQIVERVVVEDCRIHDIGAEYYGSVGVFTGYVRNTRISHNEIFDLPYSGVHLGWGWGEEDPGGNKNMTNSAAYHQPMYFDTPTPARDNLVEANHIHHVMQRMNDGGGIYTLSDQPGTAIRSNAVHDSIGKPGGIYLDEGSAHIEVVGNLVYYVAKPLNFNNRGGDRIATCGVSGNTVDRRPSQEGFPRRILEQAGPRQVRI